MPDLLRRFLWVALTMALTGCFEVGESLEIERDGSGKYEMKIDFSESREIIEALKANYHYKNDPFAELDSVFAEGALKMASIWGVENVETSSPNRYCYGLSFSFSSIDALNFALDQLDKRNTYGNHQLYYSLKGRKLRKHNRFNLRRLLNGLDLSAATDSDELLAHLETIGKTARYSLTIRVGEKLKKVECQAKYRYIDPHTMQLYASLGDILSNKVDFRTYIKFK